MSTSKKLILPVQSRMVGEKGNIKNLIRFDLIVMYMMCIYIHFCDFKPQRVAYLWSFTPLLFLVEKIVVAYDVTLSLFLSPLRDFPPSLIFVKNISTVNPNLPWLFYIIRLTPA